jgi:hypothetical protein
VLFTEGEEIAEGAELSKGGNARMSVGQVASRFALPGERDVLAGAMKEDPQSWDATVQRYYSDVLNRHGKDAGLAKIFQTPEWGGVITQALTKAKKSTDPLAGTEQVPGAELGAEEFCWTSKMRAETNISYHNEINVGQLVQIFVT